MLELQVTLISTCSIKYVYTHLEVLISELGTINALAPSPIVVGEVSSLAHELGDDPVEGGALVPEARLPGAQLPEVLCGLRHHVTPQLHRDPAQLLAPGAQVKVDPGELGLGRELTHSEG